MKFFISDLHFNHKKILDFCPNRIEDLKLDLSLVRQVKEAKEEWGYNHGNPRAGDKFKVLNKQLIDQMNERLIEEINSKVKKRDQLYILGDFAFGAIENAKKILSRINGQKILIKGNHDRNCSVMLSMGFHEVFENEEIKLGDKKVLVSHFPYLPSFWERLKGYILIKLGIWKEFDRKYSHKRIKNEGKVLLHGHIHSNIMVSGNQIHVGVESNKGIPLSELDILKIIAHNNL